MSTCAGLRNVLCCMQAALVAACVTAFMTTVGVLAAA